MMTCLVVVETVVVTIPEHPPGRGMIPRDREGLHSEVDGDEGHLEVGDLGGLGDLAAT